jgi:hypothetical protein
MGLGVAMNSPVEKMKKIFPDFRAEKRIRHNEWYGCAREWRCVQSPPRKIKYE